MEDVVKALKKEALETTPEKTTEREHFLREAAEDWADHAICTFRGKLLRKALAMSAAIADFVTELESQ